MRLPLSNDGKPVPVEQGSLCGLIPKGAKNVEVAKDFPNPDRFTPSDRFSVDNRVYTAPRRTA
jgi:hypothetical protein